MPEREQRERKLSDEVPRKGPRLNSAVRRIKMEMQSAKTSGTSFLQKAFYITSAWKSRRKLVEADASKIKQFVFWWTMLLLVSGCRTAKNNIVLQLHFGGEGKRQWRAKVSDGCSSCNSDEQKMIVSIWCSTTTYNMPLSLLDPHNSKQKAQQSWDAGTRNAEHTVSTVIHLNPFKNNFKFRFQRLLTQ